MAKDLSTKKLSENTKWDLVIKPKNSWFDIDIIEIWKYRELIYMFVKRDFVTFYKQTILGPLWYVIQPLFTTLVFTIIFGQIAKIPTDGLPPFLFYMAGNVTWAYFASSLQRTSDTFSTNAHIFGKVYFPRLTVPIAVVLVNFLQYIIQFILFLGFYFYFYLRGSDLVPNIYLLTVPLLILQMAFLGFGMGILISSMTTKYKDLRFAMNFFVQLWMYATPIIYPLSQIPESVRGYYSLNPMVSIVEGFRYAFFGVSAIELENFVTSWLITVAVVVAGVLIFSRLERTFMDTV